MRAFLHVPSRGFDCVLKLYSWQNSGFDFCLITSRLLCALFFRPKHVTRIAKHPPLRHKREALESIYYSAFALLWREEDAGRKARCFIKGVDHRSNLLGYIPENRIESLGRS